MQHIDQNSGTIRLYLTLGDFDIEQFTVLKREQFSWNDFDIDFGILGESHFVTIKHEGESLNEVCACTEAKIPDPAKLLEYDFLPNIHNTPLKADFLVYPYTFNFTYTGWEDGEKRLSALRKKESKGSVHSQTFTFPPEADGRSGVTEIYIDLGDAISIHSVHTYPNEDMMVFTESELWLK